MDNNYPIVNQNPAVKKSIEQYIESLNQCIPVEDHILLMRRYWPERYFELCKSQLSILIEMPCDDMLEFDSFTSNDWIDYSYSNNNNNETERGIEVTSSWLNWNYLINKNQSNHTFENNNFSSWLSTIRHGNNMSTTSPSRSTMAAVPTTTTTTTSSSSSTSSAPPPSTPTPLLSSSSSSSSYSQNNTARTPKLTQFLSKVFLSSNSSSTSEPAKSLSTTDAKPIHEGLVKQLERLFDYLSQPENLQTRGLFRISGCHSRVQEIKNFLLDEQTASTIPLPLHKYSVHDLACGLKAILAELGSHIFTRQLHPLYILTAKMDNTTTPTTTNTTASDELTQKLIKAKQMKAIRILYLLLPTLNQNLLRGLLQLLHRVTKQSSTLMNADSLALLFAPHLLIDKDSSSIDLRDNYLIMSNFVSILISSIDNEFFVPFTLSNEMCHHWLSRCHKMEQIPHPPHYHCNKKETDDDNDDPLFHRAPAFADRHYQLSMEHHHHRRHLSNSSTTSSSTQSLSTTSTSSQCEKTSTHYAVAELFAQVQSMPDGPKKRQFIHKLNKTNGGLNVSKEAVAFVRATASGGGLRSSIRKRMALGSHQQKPVAPIVSTNQVCATNDTNMPSELDDTEYFLTCSPFKKTRSHAVSTPLLAMEHYSTDSTRHNNNNNSNSNNNNNNNNQISSTCTENNKRERPQPARLLGIRPLLSTPPNAVGAQNSPRCSTASPSRICNKNDKLLTSSPMAFAH